MLTRRNMIGDLGLEASTFRLQDDDPRDVALKVKCFCAPLLSSLTAQNVETALRMADK